MIKLTITQLGMPKQIQTSRGMAEKNYLKATEYGDKFLNFWINNTTRAWKVGQTIEVDNVEERDYTAKDGSLRKSYDIKLANKEAQISRQLEEINGRLMKINIGIQQILSHLQPKKEGEREEIPYPEGEPDEV